MVREGFRALEESTGQVMTSDLERIAQAAYESMVKRTFGDDSIMANEANPFLRGEWSAQTQELKDDWLAVARATVEAMREPSEDMLIAGQHEIGRRKEDITSEAVYISVAFRAMIAAILNEKADD